MPLPIFEAGTTVQLTWVSSVAPDAAPEVILRDLPGGTVVSTATSISSGSTAFYHLFVIPEHEGRRHWLAEWRAEKTFTGTPYPFVQRSVFLSDNTQPNL